MKNVVFYESALLSLVENSIASNDTGSQESVSKQVELKTEHPQSVAVDGHNGEHEDDKAVEEESYNIAKGRQGEQLSQIHGMLTQQLHIHFQRQKKLQMEVIFLYILRLFLHMIRLPGYLP